MQIPDQTGMKLIPIVFQQPGVTVGKLTGRGGTPDELSIEALERLPLQARLLACEPNSCTQPDQVDRLQDLPGIVATLHGAGIIAPASRTRHQVRIERGRAQPPVHRFVFSSAVTRNEPQSDDDLQILRERHPVVVKTIQLRHAPFRGHASE